jgi:hypothetical protein
MQLNGWDHALKVTSDGKGLVGHAGAILLRKAADQAEFRLGSRAPDDTRGERPLLASLFLERLRCAHAGAGMLAMPAPVGAWLLGLASRTAAAGRDMRTRS